ncbi:hypothetical protein SDC9_178170 [bioreactor metagenome]|uniref:Uncharacterized protein n=1 Tax=bioreactor metagenome TaxID=1076179 RepID=A0A645GY84_9ZZZZ
MWPGNAPHGHTCGPGNAQFCRGIAARRPEVHNQISAAQGAAAKEKGSAVGILIFALVDVWPGLGQKARPVLHLIRGKLQGLLQLAVGRKVAGGRADVEFTGA